MRKYIILGTALLTILATGSCKKDEESTTKPSLSGLSINSVSVYVEAGETLTFKADVSSIAASDKSHPTIGLYWQVNTAKKDTLTRDITKSNPDFVYTADTLGTYTVYCYAFAGSDYYNTSASTSFKAIDPLEVIKGYDGSYSSIEIVAQDGKTWDRFNQFDNEYGLSFRDSPALDFPVGRLYNQEEAKTLCSDGTHLPSVADFYSSFGQADGNILAAEMMADATFDGNKMWEYFPAVQISNAKHFNAIPLGYVDITDSFNTYSHYGEYACYWTKDEENGMGKYLYIYAGNPVMQEGLGDKKTLYMSVRCVRDGIN